MASSPIRGRISRGALAGSIGIFLSRITGLARDIVFARVWGTSDALGAFLIAFTIPNLFRRLFGEGALTEAFVPLFNEKLAKDGRHRAFLLVSNAVSVVGLVLVALVGVGIGLSVVLQPLFSDAMAQLTLKLLPLLLPYAIFICLAGFLAGVLYSLQRFSIPSLAPIILNVAFIAAALFLCPMFGPDARRQVFGLGLAVLAAGILQLGVLLPVLRRVGFRWRFVPDFKSDRLRELYRLILPGMFGASVNQLNVLCDRLLAGFLGGLAVTTLYFSERLVYLPVGVFAVALTAACLPVMSQAFAAGNRGQMLDALIYAFNLVLYISLPCVLVLMLLGLPIVELIYTRGSFDADSARQTVLVLLFYAPGIPAFAAAKIVRSGFYSRKDMKTPVRVSGYCLVLNLILNVILMIPLQQRGLALSTTICAYINVGILAILLHRDLRLSRSQLNGLAAAMARLAAALVAAGLVMWWLTRVDWSAAAADVTGRLLAFLVPAAAGMFVYLLVSIGLGAREPVELIPAVLRRRR